MAVHDDDLPPPWWATLGASELANSTLSRHRAVLVLDLEHRRSGGHKVVAYSGFLMRYRDRAFWVTAGHVLPEVRNLKADTTWRVEAARLVDAEAGFEGEASALVVPFESLKFIGAAIDGHRNELLAGFDAGLLGLPPLLFEGLLANPNVKWFRIPAAAPVTEPEGWYLTGVPGETVQPVEPVGRGYAAAKMRSVCLPVQWLQSAPPELPDFPGCLYGRVLSFRTGPRDAIGQLEGTSGGAIIAIRRRADGTVNYDLVGIQSSRSIADPRLIRATGIAKLLRFIDLTIDDPAALAALLGRGTN